MVLIVGASGQVGSRAVAHAQGAGLSVRAVTRDPSKLARAAERGVEVVRGDLLSPDWLTSALEGVDQVVFAAHGLVPPSRRNTPQAVDGEGARRLIDAAARAGVRQFVFVSAGGARTETTVFGRVKRETERHLEASGVPWTVLRPSIFPENHALLLLGEPVRAGKAVQFFGAGEERLNWISADDVAADAVRCLGDASTLGTVRELRGSDHMSRREALALVEEALGVQARRQHLPVGVMRVMRALTPALHPGLHALIDLALDEIARDGDAPDEVQRADWVGPTRVRDVVRAWAKGATATA